MNSKEQEAKFDFSIPDFNFTGFGNHSLQIEESGPISLPGDKLEKVDKTQSNNTDNAWGINHRMVPMALQINKDCYGITFFTKPQLNLTDDNIRRDRKFSRLLTNNDKSIQRIVRCTLDPRLLFNGHQDAEGQQTNDSQATLSCPLVDRKQAFIPFFTNNLVSLSGFPDLRVPTYSAKEGPYKEAYGFADGPTDDYTEYDVTASFRSLQGDPISNMAFFWEHYQSKVHEGVMYAYGDFIISREIDYNTRIYRFVLDPSKRFIQRMGCSGASFPIALNNGSNMDYDITKPYNNSSEAIQIPFKCYGFLYEDDIIVRSFNDVVSYFNADMASDDMSMVSKPNENMVKIPFEHLSIFNHRGYPWINPQTYELEWYVSSEYYESKISSFKQFTNSLVNGLGII